MTDPTANHTFDRFIATHENGDLNHELSEALREMTATLSNHFQAYRGKPKATLKVSFDIVHVDGHLEVSAKVETKLPAAPRAKGIYYATDKNELTRRDPKQLTMPFRDVNGGEQQARDVVS